MASQKNKMGSQGHCAIFLLSLIFGLAISQLKIDIRNLKTKPKTEEILLEQADFNSLESKLFIKYTLNHRSYIKMDFILRERSVCIRKCQFLSQQDCIPQ